MKIAVKFTIIAHVSSNHVEDVGAIDCHNSFRRLPI